MEIDYDDGENWEEKTYSEALAELLAELRGGEPGQYQLEAYFSLVKDAKESVYILKENPKDQFNWLAAAVSFSMLGHYESALRFLREAEKIDPDNPWLLKDFAEVYKELGNKEYALMYARAAYHEMKTQDLTKYHKKPNDHYLDYLLKRSIDDILGEVDPLWTPFNK